jgi:hypothetical protein
VSAVVREESSAMNTNMSKLAKIAGVLALVAFAGPASAQQRGGQGTQKGNVITIGEVTIVGRVQKPIASVDVSKIQPKLTLAELRQPFLDRIEEAVSRDPF